MTKILDELFHQYEQFAPDATYQEDIENARQALIETLSKEERRLLLRIIDGKDSIEYARARENFRCGFWLAWQMMGGLNEYDAQYQQEAERRQQERLEKQFREQG